MIDLTRSTTGSPLVHTVTRDPGTTWRRTEHAAIEAVPDTHATPLPAPETRWPRDGARSGICGTVSPRVLRLPDHRYRMYYTQILPRAGHPADANDYDNATTRILSAVSTDGLNWTPEPGVRLTPEQGGAVSSASCPPRWCRCRTSRAACGCTSRVAPARSRQRTQFATPYPKMAVWSGTSKRVTACASEAAT